MHPAILALVSPTLTLPVIRGLPVGHSQVWVVPGTRLQTELSDAHRTKVQPGASIPARCGGDGGPSSSLGGQPEVRSPALHKPRARVCDCGEPSAALAADPAAGAEAILQTERGSSRVHSINTHCAPTVCPARAWRSLCALGPPSSPSCPGLT